MIKKSIKKNKGSSAPHIFKMFCIQGHSLQELKNMVLQHMFDFKIREKKLHFGRKISLFNFTAIHER